MKINLMSLAIVCIFQSACGSSSSSMLELPPLVQFPSQGTFAKTTQPSGFYLSNETTIPLIIRHYPKQIETPVQFSPQATKFIESAPGMMISILQGNSDEPRVTHIGSTKLPTLRPSDHVECERLTIQEDETAQTFEVIKSDDSILLCNRTLHDKLYYSWYVVTKKLLKEKSYARITLPRDIGTKGECFPVFLPHQANAELVVTYNEKDLQPNSVKKPFCAISKDDLASKSREWVLLGGPHRALEFQTANDMFSVINTTNSDKHYCMVRYSEGEARQIVDAAVHILGPQKRTLIPHFSSKELQKGLLKLVVSNQPIEIADLNRDELPENIRPFDWPSDVPFERSLLIVTKLDDARCPFEVIPFQGANAGLLRAIYLALTPAKRNFAPGILAQIEHDIFSLNQRADLTKSRKLLKKKIAELPKEKEFLEKRQDIVWQGIVRLLGKEKIEQIIKEEYGNANNWSDSGALVSFLKSKFRCPRIAFVSTGGGYRAMVETIGFLKGAEELGILDCVLYMCGLSGSTWAMTALVASHRRVSDFAAEQRKKVNVALNQPAPYDLEKLFKGSLRQLFCDVAPVRDYVRRTLVQSRYNQTQGLVGYYGHALANVLLEGMDVNGKKKHDIAFSDLQKNLEKAEYPLPLCVAVESIQDTKDRTWVEFSPYYVGTYKNSQADAQGRHIETENFGSLFQNGKMIQFAPEYPLAQLFGIWGSAFALNGAEVKAKFHPILGGLVESFHSFEKRFAPCVNDLLPTTNRLAAGEAPSFLFVSSERSNARTELDEQQKMFLIDAGISKAKGNTHNFATVPALAREVDILVLCDCTSKPSEEIPQHLLASQSEAGHLGYPFPRITEKHIELINHELVTSIYISQERREEDDDSENTPTVIYMRGKNYSKLFNREKIEGNRDFDPDPKVAKFTSTYNFSYKPEEYDALLDHAYNVMTYDNMRKGTHEDYVGAKEHVKRAIEQALRKIITASFSSARCSQE